MLCRSVPFRALPGLGARGTVDGREVVIGRARSGDRRFLWHGTRASIHAQLDWSGARRGRSLTAMGFLALAMVGCWAGRRRVAAMIESWRSR